MNFMKEKGKEKEKEPWQNAIRWERQELIDSLLLWLEAS